MFYGRVSGVGGISDLMLQMSKDLGTGPGDLYPTRPGWDFPEPIKKPEQPPTPTAAPAPAKPAGSALPLLLGAAYLLLS
jgi:hypothetical protein